jgi:hypothetical protein
MTTLEIVLSVLGLIVVPIFSGVISFLFLKRRSEREQQRQFESKLREMLTERNRHLSKLVESLLYESVDMMKSEISDSDYKESISQAAVVVNEMNDTISALESEESPNSIVGMTLLQKKLQDMVDNLDEKIVAMEELEQDSKSYKELH